MSGEHIRIGDVEPRIQYVADGAQTAFTFPFPIFAAGDLAVHLDALPQTEGFEVLGAGADEGGSVVFAAAPASGVRVTLRRALAIRRQTDFQEGGELRAATLNDELDYQIASLQEIESRVGRSLRLDEADTPAGTVLPPAEARAGRLLGFNGLGAPVAYALAAAPADLASGSVVAAGSLAPRSLADRFAAPADILDDGAKRDGASDDLSAFERARDRAGADGVVLLSGPGTYRFGEVRPDLSGTTVAADPGATLRVDENPNTREMRLLTPLRVFNPVHNTDQVKPANVNLPLPLHNLGAAAAAALEAGTAKTERLVDFTDGWVNLATSGSGVDTSAGTATVTAHKVAWGSAFEAGQEGIYLERRPEVGDHYQATLVQDGAGDVLGFAGGEILTATQRYSFIVTSNQGQFRVFESATGFTVDIDPLPNGGAYSLAPKAGDTPGACTIGLRLVTPTTVEVYLNGYRVHTQALDGEVVLFGWTTSWHLSGYLSIENPVLIRGARPQSPRPLKIACVGDSITYGAWASIPYPELLRMMAQNLPGLGRLTMTNLGVSGTSSADWASGDQAGQDYSGYDYVLVMLGTNDVQATTPVADYIDNMETITDAIVADGAVPIVGIFPIWSRSDLTGVPGVTASNYAYGTIYRSELRKWAIGKGYVIADCEDAFGPNYLGPTVGWLNDNIHPTVEGLVAVAKAFAAALLRAEAPQVERPEPTRLAPWTAPTLLNSWVNLTSGTWSRAGYRRLPDGRVELRGALGDGTVQTGSGGRIFQLPPDMVPGFHRGFAVLSENGSGPVLGHCLVHSDGYVYAWRGGNTKFVLDGIVFDPRETA